MRHLDKMPKLPGQEEIWHYFIHKTELYAGKNSIHKWFLPCIDGGRKIPRDSKNTKILAR